MTEMSEGLSQGGVWKTALQAEKTDSAKALRSQRTSYVYSTKKVSMTGAESGEEQQEMRSEREGGQVP